MASLVVEALLYTGVFVGAVLIAYFAIGFLAYLLYDPETADEPAEKVRLVVTTIGSEHVRSSLMDCLEHHREAFGEYELYCLTDEGADLEDELRAYEGYETIVVPDSFDCEAVAKGRAIQYFIETVVAEDPDYWYSFVDDDNLVLDDRFLYEIPHYEERGYGAMNSVLTPRKGDSTVTYIMDHVRLLDDLTVFRGFTGLLGRPYVGFHGELLTARGDVLLDVGFDRHSIVEDYAFAAELIKNDVRTWQSGTHVSILSPHSLRDLFEQRSRWFVGTWNLLWDTSPVTRAVTGVRLASWLFAVVAGPLGTVLWYYSGGIAIPAVLRVAPPLAGVVYGGTYLYGVLQVVGADSYAGGVPDRYRSGARTLSASSPIHAGAHRMIDVVSKHRDYGTAAIRGIGTGGTRSRLALALGIPLYAAFEAVSPFYAIFFSDNEFTVIEK